MSDKILVKFHQYYGRMGSLDGLFVTTQAELESLYGKEVYFGEVLGKHSNICTEMDAALFRVLDLSTDIVEKIEAECGSTISGLNPFDYYEEDEEDEDEDE